MQRYGEAGEALKKVVSLLPTWRDDEEAQIQYWIELGHNYAGRENFSHSLAAIDSALAIADRISSLKMRLAALNKRHWIYARQGNYPEAYRQLLLWTSEKDSLFNKEKTQGMNELIVAYGTREKEQALRALQGHEQATRNQVQKQRFFLTGALGTLGLFLIIGVLIIRNLRLRRRHAEQQAQLQTLLAKQHLQGKKCVLAANCTTM